MLALNKKIKLYIHISRLLLNKILMLNEKFFVFLKKKGANFIRETT